MQTFFKQSFRFASFCLNSSMCFNFLEIDTSILLFLFVLSFLYDPLASRPTFSAGMFKAL